MSSDVRQIRVGGHWVGMSGLDAIFSTVKVEGHNNPKRIKSRLLSLARRENYIAVPAEGKYCDALYREYQRFCGENVEVPEGASGIRVLGPGCARCDELMRRIRNVLAELNISADVEHIRDLKSIASYGPLTTPVLVVNDKVVVSGSVPSPARLAAVLRQNLLAESS